MIPSEPTWSDENLVLTRLDVPMRFGQIVA